MLNKQKIATMTLGEIQMELSKATAERRSLQAAADRYCHIVCYCLELQERQQRLLIEQAVRDNRVRKIAEAKRTTPKVSSTLSNREQLAELLKALPIEQRLLLKAAFKEGSV